MWSIESNIESLMTADDLPQRLAATLASGHRGRLPRAGVSPQLSYGRHAGPAPHTARAAAVLLLLYRNKGRWHLPLTQRPETLAHHGGQISLPGGAVEIGESSDEAALRELREELGVDTNFATLGRLTDSYVYASDFLITPWIAAADFKPEWQPCVREVQSVVELPLDTLFNDRAVGRLTIERGPLMFHAPCIRLGDARVWGATSIILYELADVLRHIAETS